MTAKGYATSADVARHMGRSFTPEQETEADTLIEAGEFWIDAHTGRSWLGGVLNEDTDLYEVAEDHFDLSGPLLFLRGGGAVSISSVIARASWDDASPSTLVSATDYEPRDLANGVLYLPSWLSYERVRITYVPLAAAPALIRLACIKLTAFWLRGTLGEGGDGIASYAISGDVSVTYQQVVADRGVPAEVLGMLPRRMVLA